MRRIDGVVGNRHDDPELDDAITAHERAGTLERVNIDSSDRKKSRFRTETDAGTDLGILVGERELRSGDVLFVDEERACIVTFETREAYVIELPDLDRETIGTAIELGHRIGNQHWDLAIEHGAVYVPVEAEKRIVEDVLGEYVPNGSTTRYEVVEAELFLDGEDAAHADHEHSHTGDHEHSHTGGHTHADNGESPTHHDHTHE